MSLDPLGFGSRGFSSNSGDAVNKALHQDRQQNAYSNESLHVFILRSDAEAAFILSLKPSFQIGLEESEGMIRCFRRQSARHRCSGWA